MSDGKVVTCVSVSCKRTGDIAPSYTRVIELKGREVGEPDVVLTFPEEKEPVQFFRPGCRYKVSITEVS